MIKKELIERYKVLISTIETDDGIEFLAEYREFTFCGGSGKTIQEAVDNAKENLEIYMEELIDMGKPIPDPIEELSYSGKFTVRLSKTLHKKVAESAEREGVSLNAFVAEAIAERVGVAAGGGLINRLKDTAAAFSELLRDSKPALQAAVDFNEQMSRMRAGYMTKREVTFS